MYALKFLVFIVLATMASAHANTMNIIMGGFNSCGREPIYDDQNKVVGSTITPMLSDMHGKLLEEQAKGQIAISQNPYIVSCHDMNGNIFYVRSDRPNQIFDLKTSDGVENREEKFKEAIEEMYSAHKDQGIRKLNLVGHSHGGWLAMEMAEKLDKNIKIDQLYTIDPISKVHCGIGEYSTRFFGDPHPDCTRYPRDFTRERIAAIEKRVNTWKNYWQDQTAELHSSPIPGIENQKMRMTHTGIDNSDFVWNQINQDITDQHNHLRDCLVDSLDIALSGITSLMMPGIRYLMINSNTQTLTRDQKIDPLTIRQLNDHLARGDFAKVEEFIRANPAILDYEEFDPIALFNLARFFEEGHGNKEHTPELKPALKLYAQSLQTNLTDLPLEQRLTALEAREAAIDRIIDIFTTQPEQQQSREIRGSIEYWRGQRGENRDQLRATQREIEQRDNPREERSGGGLIRGLFGR